MSDIKQENKPLKKTRKPRYNQRDRYKEFLQAADKLFNLKGFENTTIRDIAKEAGASVGLLFSYFDNKDTLILELTKERGLKSSSNLNEILNPELPLEEVIFNFFVYQIKFSNEYALSQVLFISTAIKNRKLGDEWNLLTKELRYKPIREFLQKKIAQGEIKKTTDLQVTSDMIIGIAFYIGVIQRFVMNYSEEECLSTFKKIANILAIELGI